MTPHPMEELFLHRLGTMGATRQPDQRTFVHMALVLWAQVERRGAQAGRTTEKTLVPNPAQYLSDQNVCL